MFVPRGGRRKADMKIEVLHRFMRGGLIVSLTYVTCALLGCGSFKIDPAFRIRESQERPGYPYVVILSAREVGYLNVHQMKVGKMEAERSIELFFKKREGTFKGEDIPHSAVGPFRGEVILTATAITISLEVAGISGFGDEQKLTDWGAFEFNGQYKLVPQ